MAVGKLDWNSVLILAVEEVVTWAHVPATTCVRNPCIWWGDIGEQLLALIDKVTEQQFIWHVVDTCGSSLVLWLLLCILQLRLVLLASLVCLLAIRFEFTDNLAHVGALVGVMCRQLAEEAQLQLTVLV